MKKNLFLRLCLMMIALLSFLSCRQDLLPEKETYHNTSAFQLTSKRISLNESKHKAKLLPELEKVEAKFKAFSKTNTQGKTVNYGNGVSIDTDDVTYIENGPNYHTYTFNIKRENAPADAPVENLVLSPLTDGTYRELLFSYNLSPQEKQILMNGGFVDTKNKVTVTDLQKGTFNNGGQLAKNTVCDWSIETYFTTCGSGDHSNGEPDGSGEPGTGTCAADIKSQLIVMVVGDCKEIADPDGDLGGGSSPSGPSSPGGSGDGTDDGSGNTDSPSNQPGDCNGSLTAPQTPNYDISDGGCGSSIPTQPNLPIKDKTPCAKIKEQRNDEAFNKRIDTLKGKTGLTKETGYIQKWGGSYEYKDNAGATDVANTLTLPDVTPTSHNYIKAFMHTHINDKPNSDKKGIKMFSPADAAYFMDLIQNAQTKGESLSDPYAVMVTNIGNYQIRFTGNKFQIKTFTDVQAKSHNEPFGEFMKNSMDTSKKLELGFLQYIQKEMLLYGITLYRMNANGTTTEIKLNADKTDTEENNCPN